MCNTMRLFATMHVFPSIQTDVDLNEATLSLMQLYSLILRNVKEVEIS